MANAWHLNHFLAEGFNVLDAVQTDNKEAAMDPQSLNLIDRTEKEGGARKR